MAFANFAKQFKGTCNNCGQYGHKGVDCPQKTRTRKPEGRDQGKLICWYCGEEGHTREKCKIRQKGKKAFELAQRKQGSGDEVAAWAIEPQEEDDLEDYLSDDGSYYGEAL